MARDPTLSPASRRESLRLTRSVFADLAIRMIGLGLLTGVAFPFFVLLLGVDARQALSAPFFAATVAAGLMVGAVNYWLCRAVVGARARLLSARMRLVGDTIRFATATGDWSDFDPERCRLTADSDDELGESARAFNQVVDAIERLHAVEAELELSRSQARTDELTGLGNRRHFYLAAEAQLHAPRAASGPLALILLDLDRFKEINDTLGHHVGDELLRQLARRLQGALPDASVLARLGGDEFVALLPAATGAPAAMCAAATFLSVLDQPFALDGLLVPVGASVGIAISPDHGMDRSTLLRHADVAMYRAKAAGGGIEVYANGSDAHGLDRVVLAGELHAALERDELVLHFQPKGDLATGEIRGVEALVRWQHPSLGMLAPDRFIALAEQHGLMRRLTLHVLELAADQQHGWRRAGIELPIAVNISPTNLLDVRFPDDVAELLERRRMPPGTLQFEITENTVMRDPARALDTLARLSELGIAFALDDFGTGYSSLAQLKRLPVGEIKVDRSFVADMTSSPDDATIVRSTVELGRNLGLHVVAEGVETADQWRELAAIGCHTAQGYYLSRPLPGHELTAWLIDRARRSADLGPYDHAGASPSG